MDGKSLQSVIGTFISTQTNGSVPLALCFIGITAALTMQYSLSTALDFKLYRVIELYSTETDPLAIPLNPSYPNIYPNVFYKS